MINYNCRKANDLGDPKGAEHDLRREKVFIFKEVRQRTDFGEQRISCRIQAHTAALSEMGFIKETHIQGITTQAV
jgi:hypothetical protein